MMRVTEVWMPGNCSMHVIRYADGMLGGGWFDALDKRCIWIMLTAGKVQWRRETKPNARHEENHGSYNKSVR